VRKEGRLGFSKEKENGVKRPKNEKKKKGQERGRCAERPGKKRRWMFLEGKEKEGVMTRCTCKGGKKEPRWKTMGEKFEMFRTLRGQAKQSKGDLEGLIRQGPQGPEKGNRVVVVKGPKQGRP